MYRNILNELAAWFEEQRRRILYIKGAHGVGKTWTIKDFSTAFFSKPIYIDLQTNERLFSILCDYNTNDSSIDERIQAFEAFLPEENALSDSIIIFDNMLSTEESDRLFHEFSRRHRKYVICLIASSMQVTEYEYHHPDVFKLLRMRPMTFEEYMIANKANPFISAIECSKAKPLNPLEEAAIMNLLREYLLIGGMPEAVQAFCKSRDYKTVREIQNRILSEYESIFKRQFSQALAQRIRRVWRSIPAQLTHENKKFMYRFVEENARAREYLDAVQALCDLGVARKLPRLISGELPLENNVDYKSFELFMLDHGLLQAAYKNPVDDGCDIAYTFTEHNNAIAEQFIFQELSSKMGNIYYWVSGATARVPFVYESDNAPVPVDIRFSVNNKAQNIKAFRSKNPDTEISIRISLEQVSLDSKVLNIPIYGLWAI
ncbi:MAG: DUF4143 domain-containing protein [Wujia sp.]